MAGSVVGGQKARDNIKAWDPDFYKRIGAIGGANGNTGGFAGDYGRARAMGARGGSISRRGHKYLYTKDGYHYYTLKRTGMTVKYEVKQ